MTLLETLVALAVFLILLVISFQLIRLASNAWSYATSKVGQFREARGGLSLVESRLGKATLDEYLGYEFDSQGYPSSWGRRSELRFLSGPASTVIGGQAGPYDNPTHAIFFTAPLGVTSDPQYKGLPGLLNICGYFIEWSNQDADRPAILPASKEYRFRLMQFLQPAEEMTLYSETATDAPTFTYKPAAGWQQKALQASPDSIRPIADNVVALIVEPVSSVEPNAPGLTSDFQYDSSSSNANPAKNFLNRLPPAVRIIVYTIDEVSAKRIASSPDMPDLYGSLFTDASRLHPNGSDKGDLARFEDNLTSHKLSFNRKEITVELVPRPWSTTNNL